MLGDSESNNDCCGHLCFSSSEGALGIVSSPSWAPMPVAFVPEEASLLSPKAPLLCPQNYDSSAPNAESEAVARASNFDKHPEAGSSSPSNGSDALCLSCGGSCGGGAGIGSSNSDGTVLSEQGNRAHAFSLDNPQADPFEDLESSHLLPWVSWQQCVFSEPGTAP